MPACLYSDHCHLPTLLYMYSLGFFVPMPATPALDYPNAQFPKLKQLWWDCLPILQALFSSMFSQWVVSGTGRICSRTLLVSQAVSLPFLLCHLVCQLPYRSAPTVLCPGTSILCMPITFFPNMTQHTFPQTAAPALPRFFVPFQLV